MLRESRVSSREKCQRSFRPKSNDRISVGKQVERAASVRFEKRVYNFVHPTSRRPEAELFAVTRLHPDHGLFLRQTAEVKSDQKH